MRGGCPECHRTSFISNGAMACCGSPVDLIEITDIRRIIDPPKRRHGGKRSLSKNKIWRVLQEQGYRCFWCGHIFGSIYRHNNHPTESLTIHFDHVLPFSYVQHNRTANLVASCNICNGIKSALYFDTLAETRDYLKSEWMRRGYKIEEEAHIVWKMRALL